MTNLNDLESKFDDETLRNLTLWLEGSYDLETKQEIQRLMKENPEEIVNSFYTTLKFGTGGLRGVVGVGSNRMNIYNLGIYIQGLCNYLAKQPAEQSLQPLRQVLIGYDSRSTSRQFAEHAAKIFAGNDIKALLFKGIRPTPLISFGCRFKDCLAGVMITASHNPSQYNGCKIFGSDGGQIAPSQEGFILEEIKQIAKIEDIKIAPSLSHSLIEEVGEEIDEAYYQMIVNLQNYREDNQKEGGELKIVYTSLHGTGMALFPKTLKSWGFSNLCLVDEQVIPDGTFPTVAFPNPEDPAALQLGIQKLEEIQGDLLIAHDPDADRVGIAARHRNEIKILSGNQIATLLLEHICEALMSRNKLAANAAFIKTIVATELFGVIANYYQKPCFNVLPGSKYIAEKIHQWELDSQGRQFIFGAEDSCGYLYCTGTRDKDAISVSALICEMALQAKLQGKTLVDLLNEQYRRYGIYYDKTVTIKFDDTKKDKDKLLRSLSLLARRPPRAVAGENVLFLEDYQRQIRLNTMTRQSEPLLFPKANILIYWLADHSRLIIRPSGTEAKIKIYCGVRLAEFSSMEQGWSACQKRADALISALQGLMDEDERDFPLSF